MSAHYEFATATRIIFGAGKARELGAIAREFGSRAFVVTGRNADRVRPVLEGLETAGVSPVNFLCPGEPTTGLVVTGARLARSENCPLIIGIGGGSSIDAAKAIAALLANEGELFDYLEVIGRGGALTRPSVPFIAVPTTAGAGAEVTRNAVLASPEHRVKASLRSPLMLARIALVDPELTYGLPPALTATTGLDALTQLIEPYVSCRANPLTDSICVEGIRRAAGSLRRAFENGSDKSAREDMAIASLFGGLALANAGLGAVHGFAAPIGGMFSAPHGAVCASLLPHVMEANLIALRERGPHRDAVRRYTEVARLLTGSERANAADGVTWVEHLRTHLGIPPLRRYGVTANDLPSIVERALQASSMKANPIALTPDELRQVLTRAL
jgi:alcohol dehydrogenase class IV